MATVMVTVMSEEEISTKETDINETETKNGPLVEA